MNNTYLYDSRSQALLMPIGADVYDYIQRVDAIINRLFQFSTQLSSSEITCLERIRSTLEIYSFDKHQNPAATIIGGQTYFPANPSLSYAATNMTELYRLFCELQKMVISNKFENRDILFNKVQILFHQRRFSACKRLIRRSKFENADDRTWVQFYLLLCEYKEGNNVLAHYMLEELLESKPTLLYSRNFLQDLLSDPIVMDVIRATYTSSEIEAMLATLKSENSSHAAFLKQAEELKSYYRSKNGCALTGP